MNPLAHKSPGVKFEKIPAPLNPFLVLEKTGSEVTQSATVPTLYCTVPPLSTVILEGIPKSLRPERGRDVSKVT